MNRSTLFIHIGTWKTGSSTLQYHMHLNSSRLESEGIILLSKDYNNNLVTKNKIIGYGRTMDEVFIQESREKLKKTLADELKVNSRYRFVASSESFSGDPFYGFKNSDIAARTLKAITGELNLDVKIVVYLRRQDDFIESLYTQSIHLGASHSFEEFLNTFDRSSFDWELFLRPYTECFGKENLIVRRYHKKFLPGENSLIQDFGEIIGSRLLRNYDRTYSRNLGLSRDALEIVRITNKSLDGDEQYQLKNLFQAANSKQLFDKYSFFHPAKRREFLARYAESNARVAKDYFGDSDDDHLFPEEERSPDETQYEGLTREAIVINYTRALLEVNRRMKKKERDLKKQMRQILFRHRLRDRLAEYLSGYPALKSRIKKLLGRS